MNDINIFIDKNEFYDVPVTFDNVLDYYKLAKDLLISECRNRNIYLKVNLPDRETYMRRKDGIIRFSNISEFLPWHRKHVTEYHIMMGRYVPYAVINLNPGPDTPFNIIKEITLKLTKELEEMEPIDSVEIVFSGNLGFHLHVHFKERLKVTEARNLLIDFYLNKNQTIPGLVYNTIPYKNQVLFDLSTTGLGRGHISKWSLKSPTGLVALPVRKDQMLRFRKEHATFTRVLKYFKNIPYEIQPNTLK